MDVNKRVNEPFNTITYYTGIHIPTQIEETLIRICVQNNLDVTQSSTYRQTTSFSSVLPENKHQHVWSAMSTNLLMDSWGTFKYQIMLFWVLQIFPLHSDGFFKIMFVTKLKEIAHAPLTFPSRGHPLIFERPLVMR